MHTLTVLSLPYLVSFCHQGVEILQRHLCPAQTEGRQTPRGVVRFSLGPHVSLPSCSIVVTGTRMHYDTDRNAATMSSTDVLRSIRLTRASSPSARSMSRTSACASASLS